MDKISVIIPAYNAQKYLACAVSSVRQQKWHGEKEIIIVDDGSTDNTLGLAEKLGDIILSKKHEGAAKARNKALEAACGNYIFFLDADDILTQDCLLRLYEPFINNSSLEATFAKAEDFLSEELTDTQKKSLSVRPSSYFGVLPGCSLLKKSVFDKIGFFDETLKSGETVAWQIKLRQQKILTLNIDFVSLKRRLHLNNTGRVSRLTEMKNYANILRQKMKTK